MSHIAVDLKVIEVKAPAVARAAGVDPDRVLAGLVRLWHRCWSLKTATIKPIELAGIFGGERVDGLILALAAFDLIEASEEVWRVKGADRYLRIQAGRIAGGKMAAGNLKRGQKTPAAPRLTPGSPPADSRLVSGLSPSTEHRTPNTEETHTGAIDLQAIWNDEKPPECPRWLGMPTTRARSANARLKDQPDLEVWRTAIRRLHQSAFCRGHGPRAWKADPEFLLKPDTLTRVLEGAFDGQVSTKAPVDAATQTHTQTGWVENFGEQP